MDGQIGAARDHVDGCLQIVEVQPGVDALRVQVERQSDEVNVPGALSVAKKRPFDAICSCEQAQFARGHSCTCKYWLSGTCGFVYKTMLTSIVMSMQTHNDVFSVLEVTTEVLDL